MLRHPSRHASLGLLVCVCLLLGSLGALAGSRPYWKGRPDFTPGQANGYFLWEDEQGWHLRWTNRGDRKRVYSGTVTCDGAFSKVKPVQADRKDYIRQESRNRITFDARTAGGMDGMDFDLSPSSRRVTFTLKLDGRTVPLDEVRIGRNRSRPASIPFTLGEGGAPAAGASASDSGKKRP